MMKNNIIFQTLCSAAIVAILFITVKSNSMMSMNPMIAHTLPYASIVILCALAIVYVLHTTGDEREKIHALYADKIAVTVIFTMLSVKLFIDQLHETYNHWVVYPLIVIVIVQISSRLWFYFKR